MFSLALDGDKLYAGGIFTNAGTTGANYIAVWYGTTWSGLGSGTSVGSPPAVYGLAAGGGNVYAGGTFFNAGEKPSTLFAVWTAPGSTPFAASVGVLPTGDRVLTWSSAANHSYQILSTSDLSLPFSPLGDLIPSGGTSTTYTDTSTPATSRFYRIVQQ